MHQRWVVAVSLLAIAGGQAIGRHARELAGDERIAEPYAPTPGASPFVALGYRELMADLLLLRLVGYFGSEDKRPDSVATVVEAMVAVDPGYKKSYYLGAQTIVAAQAITGVRDNATTLRAIRILETAAERFPTDYRIPQLLGEIYLFDLTTDDPAQRKDWDAAAASWIEAAVRKPDAPANAAALAAELRTKYGQQQRAIDNLRELVLITKDARAREELLEKLAELEDQDSAAIAAELLEARKDFEERWRTERPAVTPPMFIQIGPPLAPGFDLEDLATGGHDVITADQFERLEPPAD